MGERRCGGGGRRFAAADDLPPGRIASIHAHGGAGYRFRCRRGDGLGGNQSRHGPVSGGHGRGWAVGSGTDCQPDGTGEPHQCNRRDGARHGSGIESRGLSIHAHRQSESDLRELHHRRHRHARDRLHGIVRPRDIPHGSNHRDRDGGSDCGCRSGACGNADSQGGTGPWLCRRQPERGHGFLRGCAGGSDRPLLQHAGNHLSHVPGGQRELRSAPA